MKNGLRQAMFILALIILAATISFIMSDNTITTVQGAIGYTSDDEEYINYLEEENTRLLLITDADTTYFPNGQIRICKTYNRCNAITKTNTRCKRVIDVNKTKCFQHNK